MNSRDRLKLTMELVDMIEKDTRWVVMAHEDTDGNLSLKLRIGGDE